MAIFKALVSATVAILSTAGLLTARTEIQKPENVSLLLLGLAMIALASLVRLQTRAAVNNGAQKDQSELLEVR